MDEVLKKAAEIINGDRQKDYGDPVLCLQRIASLWSVILGVNVPTYKVALCMDAVKTARLLHDPNHEDSWVDKAGYTALGYESTKKG